MPGLSARSPLVLPWATLRLAGRFALPLALWFTVGELLRYGAMYGGYRLGQLKGAAATVAPLVTVSLLVMISLTVTVAMIHCVREGLDAVHAREPGGDLTPWAVGNRETALEALGRAVLPFMVFYLGWGLHREDAREFVDMAQSRGFAESGLTGQIEGLGMLITLERHLALAVALTAGFFALKVAFEWLARRRLGAPGAVLLAFLEINFALFGIFTVDRLRREAGEWAADRRAWDWVEQAAGGGLDLWPSVKHAVLGSLIWLVIAGVVLGLDTADERVVLGRSAAARRLARAGDLDRTGSPREVATRGLREMWLPAWYGLRLVRRSGVVPFSLFCALFMGLDVAERLARRQIYELIGPHSAAWWVPRLTLIGFATALVFQILRICLLAAAFNLVVARVTRRTAAKAAAPSAGMSSAAAPQASPSAPWRGAAPPGR
jgi:hypothetical protein